MAKIVIKKTISLDFLGDDYKDGYLIFKTIPLRNYEKYLDQAKNQDESAAVKLILDTLRDNFIEGKIPQDDKTIDVTSDDLDDFDITTAVTVFKTLTGQELDPKSTSS